MRSHVSRHVGVVLARGPIGIRTIFGRLNPRGSAKLAASTPFKDSSSTVAASSWGRTWFGGKGLDGLPIAKHLKTGRSFERDWNPSGSRNCCDTPTEYFSLVEREGRTFTLLMLRLRRNSTPSFHVTPSLKRD